MTGSVYEDLRNEIAARYGDLSNRLQQIARYALDNPDDMALETIAVLAEQAGVQPSAMIRFAKAFGFEGFSEMQRVFRSRLVDRTPRYRDRIRDMQEAAGGDLVSPDAMLGHFVEAGIGALRHLQEIIRPDQLERALELLAQARGIHIIGQRRAYGAAAYFAYALSHLGRRCHLVDGTGGMLELQAQNMQDGDLLLAISFHPYAPETLGVVQRASQANIPIIAITDTALSPLKATAAVCFEVEDAQVRGFRSLTATMCLAVPLVVGLGQHLEGQAASPKRGRRAKAGAA